MKKERAEAQLLKRREREEKKLMKEQKKREREEEKKRKKNCVRKKVVKKKAVPKKVQPVAMSLEQQFSHIQLSDFSGDEDSSGGVSDSSDAVCPKCGLVYSDSGGLWVSCDGCKQWFDLKCTSIKRRNIPDVYYCENCIT